MPLLARRSDEAERMDDASVDYATFRACLSDLSRVNRLSLGYRPTIAFLDGLRRAGRLDLGRPVEVLDVGSGYGDLLREVAAWGARKGVALRLTGLDLSPWAARAAAEATPEGVRVTWLTGDVFTHDASADLVLSSLFAHHLSDLEVARFLRWMELRARIGWFVNDLHRHPIPAYGFGPLATLLGMHPFVRHDGPASFRRAFVPEDWRRRLAEAGVPEGAARVARAAPFRLCVGRVK